MTSTPDTPSLACLSTGIPRPLSETESEPSSWSVTTISSANPAIASSAELSMTSWARWFGRSVVVYMPGRLRTGSRPVRTSMEEESYGVVISEVVGSGDCAWPRSAHRSSALAGAWLMLAGAPKSCLKKMRMLNGGRALALRSFNIQFDIPPS